jgi:hypothetical protein
MDLWFSYVDERVLVWNGIAYYYASVLSYEGACSHMHDCSHRGVGSLMCCALKLHVQYCHIILILHI